MAAETVEGLAEAVVAAAGVTAADVAAADVAAAAAVAAGAVVPLPVLQLKPPTELSCGASFHQRQQIH